jgi:hypothetical protein
MFRLMRGRIAGAVGLAAVLGLSCFAGAARAQDKVEVFGGYSYLRPGIPAEEAFSCPPGALCPVQNPTPPPTFVNNRQNLNGWEAAAGVHVLPLLRIVADFSGHYGPTVGSGASRTHQHTYLFGPEVSLPARVSPFAHVLFGVSHQTESFAFFPLNSVGDNSVLASNRTGFASAIGGGIDLKLISHVWIRPIQFDYLLTRLGGSTQNQPRVSAGIVLHF